MLATIFNTEHSYSTGDLTFGLLFKKRVRIFDISIKTEHICYGKFKPFEDVPITNESFALNLIEAILPSYIEAKNYSKPLYPIFDSSLQTFGEYVYLLAFFVLNELIDFSRKGHIIVKALITQDPIKRLQDTLSFAEQEKQEKQSSDQERLQNLIPLKTPVSILPIIEITEDKYKNLLQPFITEEIYVSLTCAMTLISAKILKGSYMIVVAKELAKNICNIGILVKVEYRNNEYYSHTINVGVTSYQVVKIDTERQKDGEVYFAKAYTFPEESYNKENVEPLLEKNLNLFFELLKLRGQEREYLKALHDLIYYDKHDYKKYIQYALPYLLKALDSEYLINSVLSYVTIEDKLKTLAIYLTNNVIRNKREIEKEFLEYKDKKFKKVDTIPNGYLPYIVLRNAEIQHFLELKNSNWDSREYEVYRENLNKASKLLTDIDCHTAVIMGLHIYPNYLKDEYDLAVQGNLTSVHSWSSEREIIRVNSLSRIKISSFVQYNDKLYAKPEVFDDILEPEQLAKIAILYRQLVTSHKKLKYSSGYLRDYDPDIEFINELEFYHNQSFFIYRKEFFSWSDEQRLEILKLKLPERMQFFVNYFQGKEEIQEHIIQPLSNGTTNNNDISVALEQLPLSPIAKTVALNVE